MSRSVNKATLIGNVGQDPEVRSTSNGGRVATFSMATSVSWNNSSGERQEKTEWHRCVVWNAGRGSKGLADVVEEYVKKGDKLFVEGSIEYRQWQDKEGQTRYTTEIRVRDLVMLSGRGNGGQDGSNDRGSDRSSNRGGQQSSKPATNAASQPPAGAGEFEDFPSATSEEDDDLPF